MADNKLVDLEVLAGITEAARRAGRKVVHCHGVFDLLHIGHIRYFQQARRMGDMLVVTLTPDRFVDKGPNRPAFVEALRAEAIASLDVVDHVAINRWPTAEETLRLLRPHVYVKGSEFKAIQSDMTGKIGREAEVVREIGAELAFTEDVVFSSTQLINTYMSSLPHEIREYLDLFKHRHPLDEVLAVVDRFKDLRVLVVGDTIIDEYVYCDAIGKSSKDPMLAVKYQSEDRFAGGVLAVANIVANFAGQVTLLSALGDANDPSAFVRSKLNPGIRAVFHAVPGRPTVTKRRLVEGYSLNKLIEIYVMDDRELPEAVESALVVDLERAMKDVDLVVVSDFGHGMVTDRLVEVLSKSAPFLAVNTQANAGNRGFNTITRYPKVDYACIAEHEMRLEARRAQGELRPMAEAARQKLNARAMVVTRGQRGCVVSTQAGDYVEVPAFAGKVVDRVGSGDAFLSVTSLAAVQGVPCELLAFLGNVVGAHAVAQVGNEKAIDALQLKKTVTSLIK
ncbi:MAG: cytidyltransferase [Lentisphaerae bacterium RIFOXYC12_FULL_60_16]|nr:MAG: cytidyltransferase [Lentisphaerae bacterium RIFOXYC12_FULL_60_16]